MALEAQRSETFCMLSPTRLWALLPSLPILLFLFLSSYFCNTEDAIGADATREIAELEVANTATETPLTLYRKPFNAAKESGAMEYNPPLDSIIDQTNIHGSELQLMFANARASTHYPDNMKHANSSQSTLHPSLPQSTVFDPKFWQQDVPLLIQNNVAVQSANLAVLILIFAQSAAGMETNHYGKALWHYGRALQLVQETSSSSRESLRPAILCCLFFVIFEIMNGDTRSAESHLWNGEKMLMELRRLELDHGGIVDMGSSVDAVSDDGAGQGGLRRELPCALQFLILQSDEPNLDCERAGYLEAFLQMATSPDRVHNPTAAGYSDRLAQGVERLL
ncbi:hypothetical protein J3F83DRAFT_594564 [Trichoderma novae-zelandiae]